MSGSLVYNGTLLGATNVLFIDSACVEAQLFFDSCNSDTFPIIYEKSAGTDELLQLLVSKFSKIDRIAFAFHDPHSVTKTFINNDTFFSIEDIDDLVRENRVNRVNRVNKHNLLANDADTVPLEKTYSQNFILLQNIISQFGVANVDFLACQAYQYSSWKKYFSLLNSKTGVKVGASSDKTGNVVGSDWTMESTGENIKPVYFTTSIDAFSGVLVNETNVSATNIYIQQVNASSPVQYSTDNINYTDITWPLTISAVGSGPCMCQIMSNLDLTTGDAYIIIGSDNVTIDGQEFVVNVNGVLNYNGFLQNSNNPAYTDITIQNIGITTSNGSTLYLSGGWLCQQTFGYGASGTISVTDCYSTGDIGGGGYYHGGIFGGYAGRNMASGTISVMNCHSTGDIGGGGYYHGGIFGGYAGYLMTGGTISVTDCYSTGDIGGGGGYYHGGIFGSYAGRNMTSGTISVSNCYSTGEIGSQVGGFFGWRAGYLMTGGTISVMNCHATGTIGAYSGGLFCPMAGREMSGGTISVSNCYSTGEIGSQAGGFFGWRGGRSMAGGTISVTNCYSTGVITGGGGIFGDEGGYAMTDGTISVTNCYSTGVITGGGGIFGNSAGNMTGGTISATNCYTTGDINGSGGGIFGDNTGQGADQALLNNTITANTVSCLGPDIFGANQNMSVSSTTNPHTNTVIGWLNSDANLVLTGVPNPVQGTAWTKINFSGTTPYLLSSFDETLYSPATTSTNTSSAGLFSNSLYSIIAVNDVVDANITIVSATGVLTSSETVPTTYNVLVLQQAAPTQTYPRGYNINTFTFVINFPCFKKGSKILTNNGYKPIESLNKYDLVKTFLHGYKPISFIGKRDIYHVASNERIKEQLYQYPCDDFGEPLVLTGAHAVLVDEFTSEKQREQVVETLGKIYLTDDKYRLPACVDERAAVYKTEGTYTIYHVALENDNYYWNYGIYANGLLVESCSKRYLKELSNMELIE